MKNQKDLYIQKREAALYNEASKIEPQYELTWGYSKDQLTEYGRSMVEWRNKLSMKQFRILVSGLKQSCMCGAYPVAGTDYKCPACTALQEARK